MLDGSVSSELNASAWTIVRLHGHGHHLTIPAAVSVTPFWWAQRVSEHRQCVLCCQRLERASIPHAPHAPAQGAETATACERLVHHRCPGPAAGWRIFSSRRRCGCCAPAGRWWPPDSSWRCRCGWPSCRAGAPTGRACAARRRSGAQCAAVLMLECHVALRCCSIDCFG